MNKKNFSLLTLLLLPCTLFPAIDITAYLQKKLKQSPVGLLRYESPESLRQIIALPFDQIMLDHNAPIEGAKVIITYDKAANYDIASRNFTTLDEAVVDEIMDNEETRNKIDKKARKKRRITRIMLKEEQMVTGFNAGLKGQAVDAVIKDQFDDKLNALRTDETTRILERTRSAMLRALHDEQGDEIEAVKTQRREKKVPPPEAKKQIEAIRKKYRDKTKELESRTLTMNADQKKELEEAIAKPMEKLNGERQAFIDGYAAGREISEKPEEEQDAKLAALRKAYQDKIEKISTENITLKEKDRTPRDMPMSIELTGVLRLIKAELIPGEGEPANTQWKMPDFFDPDAADDVEEFVEEESTESQVKPGKTNEASEKTDLVEDAPTTLAADAPEDEEKLDPGSQAGKTSASEEAGKTDPVEDDSAAPAA